MKGVCRILLIVLSVCELNAYGQSPLQFARPEWNFGSVPEENGPIVHRFEAENRGEYPEVILDVTASCGCTKPEFSRRPIRPGETTAVTVRFDPAGQSGSIDRTLVVYGSGNQVIGRLRITGRVEPRPRTIKERYPVEAGNGIRLTNNYLPFENLPHGRETGAEIGIANESAAAQRIRFVGEQTSGLLTIEAPEVLGPGEEAAVRVVYRVPERCKRYGTITDLYALETDGRRSDVRIAARGILVDAPQESGSVAPEAKASPGSIRLGDVKRNGGPRSDTLRLLNPGDAPLHVRAVETPEGFSCSLEAGTRIPAGKSLPFEIGIDPSGREFGLAGGRLLIVTDDPKHPTLRVRITANIID